MVYEWVELENKRQGYLPGLDDQTTIKGIGDLAKLLRQDARNQELQWGNFAQITRNIATAYQTTIDTAKLFYYDEKTKRFRPGVKDIFAQLNLMTSLQHLAMLKAFADNLSQNDYYLPWEKKQR